MSYKVATASQEALGFGEGPIWDERRNKLVMIDCFAKSIGILDPKSQVLSQKRIPNSDELPFITVAIPCTNSTDKESSQSSENPNFLVAASRKLIKYNWDSEKSTELFDFNSSKDGENKGSIFNDGKVDAKGRLWIGSLVQAETLGEPNAGIIHCFENIDGHLTKTTPTREYDAPNGLAWNKENTKLFYADVGKRVVNLYDYNLEEGTLENARIFFDYNKNNEVKGAPDGMVIDESGNLWVACWKGGSVIKIDGNTGKLLTTVNFPVTNTTSLCFGGEKYETLFVTTTSFELDKSSVVGQPDTGKIFSVKAPGDNSFKGIHHYFSVI